MDGMLNFTPVQLDALKEVSSISAGSASTALAQFVGKKVNMRPPEVVIVDKINEYCLPYNEGSSLFIMHSDIPGGIKGRIMFICLYEHALSLCSILLGEPQDLESEPPGGIGASSLKEVGMVMFGSYIKVLGDMINKLLLITPPQLRIGKDHSTRGYIPNNILKTSGKILCFHSCLWIENACGAPLYLIFVPDVEDVTSLLEALGI